MGERKTLDGKKGQNQQKGAAQQGRTTIRSQGRWQGTGKAVGGGGKNEKQRKRKEKRRRELTKGEAEDAPRGASAIALRSHLRLHGSCLWDFQKKTAAASAFRLQRSYLAIRFNSSHATCPKGYQSTPEAGTVVERPSLVQNAQIRPSFCSKAAWEDAKCPAYVRESCEEKKKRSRPSCSA